MGTRPTFGTHQLSPPLPAPPHLASRSARPTRPALQARGLVQTHDLPEAPTPTSTPVPAAHQPACTAACSTSQQHIAPSRRPAAAPLAALRCALRRLASGLRRRLAAAACMARPATLECGGCPGRRLGNASSGASAEWTVVHINWT